jgi:hypothetical protein
MKKAFKIFSIMFVIEIVLIAILDAMAHGAVGRFDSGDLTQH